MRIRKYKCHQKIPWIRFAGNDISNYGPIFNTADSRKKIEFFTLFVLKIRPFLNTILYDENNISNCYLLLVDLVKKNIL